MKRSASLSKVRGMMNDIPRVVSTGKLKIAEMEIAVHVLDNGQRITPEEDFLRVIAWLGITAEDLESLLSKVPME